MGRGQDLIGVDQPAAFGGVQQFGAEVRVGDADQRHGPLPHGLAVQVGHAVLGDHVMDVAARGDDAGALLQEGHDAAADAPSLVGRPCWAGPAPACRRGPWPPRA